MSSGQHELADPPSDAISAVKFSPSSTKLLVACWDSYLYLYDTTGSGASQLLNKFQHRAPILDVCFGDDDGTAYTVGLDQDVRQIDLATGTQTVLSTHTAGVRSVVYDSAHKLLISGSWDRTLHVHNLASASSTPSYITIARPGKPFSISISASKVVVAMAARAVYIYELSSLASAVSSSSSSSPQGPTAVKPWQQRESSLKFMTRAVACMPTDLGYASSSIEGRVAVEWFDPSPASQARKYAFKCHRQQADPSATEGAAGPVDVVYPVNALAFHPVHGTFASGGGDGVVALWDGVAKRRIRQYQRYTAGVAALAFSPDGKKLAVGVCGGFEDRAAATAGDGDAAGGAKVFVRELSEGETKGKAAK